MAYSSPGWQVLNNTGILQCARTETRLYFGNTAVIQVVRIKISTTNIRTYTKPSAILQYCIANVLDDFINFPATASLGQLRHKQQLLLKPQLKQSSLAI